MSTSCKQMMCWKCQKGQFHLKFTADVGDTWTPYRNDADIVFCVGWRVDPIKKWSGHCILWKCNCNCCFGWHLVGRENVMEDNMFVLHIKKLWYCSFRRYLWRHHMWWEIVISFIVFTTTGDNMSADSFFMMTSRQYTCQRWHALAMSCMLIWTYGIRCWHQGGWLSRWTWIQKEHVHKLLQNTHMLPENVFIHFHNMLQLESWSHSYRTNKKNH